MSINIRPPVSPKPTHIVKSQKTRQENSPINVAINIYTGKTFLEPPSKLQSTISDTNIQNEHKTVVETKYSTKSRHQGKPTISSVAAHTKRINKMSEENRQDKHSTIPTTPRQKPANLKKKLSSDEPSVEMASNSFSKSVPLKKQPLSLPRKPTALTNSTFEIEYSSNGSIETTSSKLRPVSSKSQLLNKPAPFNVSLLLTKSIIPFKNVLPSSVSDSQNVKHQSSSSCKNSTAILEKAKNSSDSEEPFKRVERNRQILEKTKSTIDLTEYPLYEEPSFLFSEQDRHQIKTEPITSYRDLDITESSLYEELSPKSKLEADIGSSGLVVSRFLHGDSPPSPQLSASRISLLSAETSGASRRSDWSDYSETEYESCFDYSESERSSTRSSFSLNIYESDVSCNTSTLATNTRNTFLRRTAAREQHAADDLNSSAYDSLKSLNKRPSKVMSKDGIENQVIGLHTPSRENHVDSHLMEKRVVIKSSTWFIDEPLYQFYTESASDKDADQSETFGSASDKIGGIYDQALTDTTVPHEQYDTRSSRTCWSDVPEVKASVDLATLSKDQLSLQELKYELLSTEASFLNSMTLLEQHFVLSPELQKQTVLSDEDRTSLFSKVKAVRLSSTLLFNDLNECWGSDVMLRGMFEILRKHIDNSFTSFVAYCSNQEYMSRTYQRLRKQGGRLTTAITMLERSPACQRLPLHSFFILPIQRITRLLLLAETMLKLIPEQEEEYDSCKKTVEALKKVVDDCNAAANHSNKRIKRLLELNQLLKFKHDVIKPLQLIANHRWLVMSGGVIKHDWLTKDLTIFRSKITPTLGTRKSTIVIYLFNDLIVLAKKKSEGHFLVVDYCARNLAIMSTTNHVSHLPSEFKTDSKNKYMLMLTMLENHERKYTEMILSSRSEKDRNLWLFEMQPLQSIRDDFIIESYKKWDCPIVTVILPFTASHHDELTLVLDEQIRVITKYADDWFKGIKKHDGEIGSFPAYCVKEIPSPHAHAKQLNQIYAVSHKK